MNKLKLFKFGVGPLLALAAALLFFQNCGQSFLPARKGGSPFAGGKIKMNASPSAQGKLRLAVLIDEKRRATGECDANVGFSANYITAAKWDAEQLRASPLALHAHVIEIDENQLDAEFAARAEADACVVGVSSARLATEDQAASPVDWQVFDPARDPKTASGWSQVSSQIASEIHSLNGEQISVAVVGANGNPLFNSIAENGAEPMFPGGLDIKTLFAFESDDTKMNLSSESLVEKLSTHLKPEAIKRLKSREDLVSAARAVATDANEKEQLAASAAPLTMPSAAPVEGSGVFNGILEAINSGAEVIYLPIAANTRGCDPLLGEAIFRAVQAGRLVIMPAGDQGRSITAGQLDGTDLLPTVSPACWGPTFPGAITVGGAENRTEQIPFETRLTSTSNFGSAVELLAPGSSIPVNGSGPWSGTLLAAPQILPAVAWLKAIHKNRKWEATPGDIEEILRRGSARTRAVDVTKFVDRVLYFPNLTEVLNAYVSMNPEERARWLQESQRNPEAAAPSAGENRILSLKSKNLLVPANSDVQLEAHLIVGNVVAAGDIGAQVEWTASESALGNVTIENGHAIFHARGRTGRLSVNGKFKDGLITLNADLDLVVTPPAARLNGAGIMFRSGSGGWRKFTTGLMVDRSRAEGQSKIHLAMSATGSDGLARDISDSATFFIANNGTADWRKTEVTLEPSSLAAGTYQIMAVSGNLTATSTLTISSAVPASAATPLDPGSTRVATLSYRVTRGWLELDPVKLTDVFGTVETRPFADFDIFLQSASGAVLFLSRLESQGLYFLKLYDLADGSYRLIVRSRSDTNLFNTSDFVYIKSSTVYVGSNSYSPPGTFQPPFITKAPTGACANASERNRAPFASGNGTLLAPYVICNNAQFLEMLRLGKMISAETPVFRLRDHLNLASIPNYDNNPVDSFSLNGCTRLVLEGNGYTIRGLTQTAADRDFVGMFSCLRGVVSNLILVDPIVSGRDGVGAVAGIFYGNMNNVMVYGAEGGTNSVRGRNRVGGLIGASLASNITGSGTYRLAVSASGNFVGGIVGWIEDCATLISDYVREGSIFYSGAIGDGKGISFGGLSGHPKALVYGSLFDGKVRGNRNVCGIGGTTIIGSRSAGEISALEANAAGLVCDEYDTATGLFQSVKNGGYGWNLIEAKVSAPANATAVFITGSYLRRTSLISQTLKATLSTGSSMITGVVVSDEYAEVAKAFDLANEVYDNFFWYNDIFHTPPHSRSTPEVGLMKRYLSLSNITAMPNFDHPAVNPTGMGAQSLSFTPASVSNKTTLNVAVSGAASTAYSYKVGPADSTTCSEEKGYTAAAGGGENLQADISKLSDGEMLLCVRPVNREPTSAALLTEEWVKDTKAPPAPAIQVVNGNLKVSGNSEIKNFLYKFGPAWNVDCAARADYSGPVNDLSAAEKAVSSQPYAAVKLCVIGLDAAGNEASPVSRVWTSLGDAPVKVELTGLPHGMSNVRKSTVRATGFNLKSYRVKFGSAMSVNCADESGYSGIMDVNSAFLLDVSNLPDGRVAICAMGQDMSDRWAPAEASARFEWTKDSVPPQGLDFLIPQPEGVPERIYVSVTGDLAAYIFKLGPAAAGDCASQDGYSEEHEASEPILVDYRSMGQGLTLCVRARDGAGNWMDGFRKKNL